MTGEMRELQCAVGIQVWKRPPSIGRIIENAALGLSLVEWTGFHQVEMGERLAE